MFVIDRTQGLLKPLIEGTKGTVSITNNAGVEVLTRSFNSKEAFQDFIRENIVSFPGYAVGYAALVPPRTGQGLLQDVLFPTVIHHTTKQGIVNRVAGLALDIFTFVPRAIMTPFNNPAPAQAHPLEQWLDPVGIASLNSGSLTAHLTLDVVEINKNEGHISVESKTITVSQPILTIPNMPCPIQETVTTKTHRASFEGRILSDGQIYTTKHTEEASNNSSTTYHLFFGFEKAAVLNNAIFYDD